MSPGKKENKIVYYPLCNREIDDQETKEVIEELDYLYGLISFFNDEIISQKYRESEMIDIIESLDLGPESVVIDLGTHMGEQIEDLAKLGAEVHAFEPHPMFFKILKEKFSNYKNVIINNVAAGAQSGPAELFYQESKEAHNGGASLVIHKVDTVIDFFDKVERSESVCHKTQCMDISEYIHSLDKKVDILKIDVEGLEYVILARIIETGAINKVDHIFFADHRDDFLAQSWFGIAIEAIKQATSTPDVIEKMFSRHTQDAKK